MKLWPNIPPWEMCPKRTILVVTCCFNATSNRYPLAVNCGSVNVPGRSSTCSEKVHHHHLKLTISKSPSILLPGNSIWFSAKSSICPCYCSHLILKLSCMFPFNPPFFVGISDQKNGFSNETPRIFHNFRGNLPWKPQAPRLEGSPSHHRSPSRIALRLHVAIEDKAVLEEALREELGTFHGALLRLMKEPR